MELIITPTQALLPLSVLFVVYHAIRAWFSRKPESKHWDELPSVGVQKQQWFAWVWATLKSVRWTQDWAFEGYRKFAPKNSPFILPSIDRGAMIILPPRLIKAVYSLPESILDIHATQSETIQTKWTVWDKEVADNDFQINVVRNQITRNLETLTPLMADELKRGFDLWWGGEVTDGGVGEWKEVKVWDACLKLIAGASNGAFCGAPLCRDEQFLNDLRDHAMSIFAGAMLINASPRPLKPITGFLVGSNCWYLRRKAMKGCLPFVKERLDNTAKFKANPNCGWTPPKDGLQWLIDECYAAAAKGDPGQLEPKRVAHRLLLVNDISLHSTSFTVQNVILDLFSSDPELGFVDALRDEAASVLAKHGGSWTRDAVRDLKLIDSMIRESMRLNPFAIVGLPRTVVHPEGIRLPVSNVHVPQGTMIAVPMEPVHYDESIYPQARSFNAFRFADPNNVTNIVDNFTIKEDLEKAAEPERKAKSTATLDDAFLGFGFGRHACPGRFFALNEMKVFFAHMLLNYDVEYMKVRPKPLDTVWLKLPLHGGKIRVRRRVAHV
ncbi:ent-kaurene oxidase [Paraphoma chrysanthemicola]|nr:ent-kaurene oxidase [Paraphoma chrysanthemicola]